MSEMKVSDDTAGRYVHLRAFERLRAICGEIRKGSYPSLARLARVTDVNARTVQRTIRELRAELDAPIAFDRQRKGFYFTDPAWKIPALTLTEGELVAFFAAEQFIRRLGSESVARQARDAVRGLAALLPNEVVVNLAEVAEAMEVLQDPGLEASPEHLRQLVSATRERRTLNMHYRAPHRPPTIRDVDPLKLVMEFGDWYVITHDHKSGEIRDFNVGRVLHLYETGRTFDPPDGFDVERHLRSGFGMFRGGAAVKVVVEFDAYQAVYIRERRYHATQRNEELDGDRLRVQFDVTEAALGQVARWVMSYGSHARATAPDALRRQIGDEARRMAAMYENDS